MTHYQMYAYNPGYCALALCLYGSKAKPTDAEKKIAAEHGYKITQKTYYPNVEQALDVVRGLAPCNWQVMDLNTCPGLEDKDFKGKCIEEDVDVIAQTWTSTYGSERSVELTISALHKAVVGV